MGVIDTVFDLIFKPGTSLKLVPVINVSILLLLVLLGALSYSGIDSIHLVVMGILALGLLLSVNWVLSVVREAKEQENNKAD
jgi:hypothetical protein